MVWLNHESQTHGMYGQCSNCRRVGGGYLNPLAHLNDPLAQVNVNPFGGRGGRCNPPSSYHSVSMNDLLLITTRPPLTTMHCIPCTVIWAYFGYKDKFYR